MFKHLIIGTTLCMLCCSEGAAKIAIHEKMTEDELNFYFGETSYENSAHADGGPRSLSANA